MQVHPENILLFIVSLTALVCRQCFFLPFCLCKNIFSALPCQQIINKPNNIRLINSMEQHYDFLKVYESKPSKRTNRKTSSLFEGIFRSDPSHDERLLLAAQLLCALWSHSTGTQHKRKKSYLLIPRAFDSLKPEKNETALLVALDCPTVHQNGSAKNPAKLVVVAAKL